MEQVCEVMLPITLSSRIAFSLKCFWYSMIGSFLNLNIVQSEDTIGAFWQLFYRAYIRFWSGAGDTAQQVKVLATKDLSLTPGTHIVERENWLLQVAFCIYVPAPLRK